MGQFGQEALSVMPKGGMPDVMAQAGRFDEVFIQTQIPSYGSGHPWDQLDMNDPVGQVVIVDQGKDLGFIDIPGKGKGIQNPVGICWKSLPVFVGCKFFIFTPEGGMAETSQGTKVLLLPWVQKGFEFPGFFEMIIQ